VSIALDATHQPSLVYQRAFNLCASLAQMASRPIAVLAGDAFHLRELLRRIEGEVAVIWQSNDAASAPNHPDALGRGIVCSPVTLVTGGRAWTEQLAEGTTLVWAEPQATHLSRARGLLDSRALARGQVLVLASNRSTAIFRKWRRRKFAPARRKPLGSRRAVRFLRSRGFIPQRSYGFHGPASLVLGALARPLTLLGRLDLADRIWMAVRRESPVRGRQAAWAVLTVTLAEQEGHYC
jgi:hypothetical protein